MQPSMHQHRPQPSKSRASRLGQNPNFLPLLLPLLRCCNMYFSDIVNWVSLISGPNFWLAVWLPVNWATWLPYIPSFHEICSFFLSSFLWRQTKLRGAALFVSFSCRLFLGSQSRSIFTGQKGQQLFFNYFFPSRFVSLQFPGHSSWHLSGM